ncbi:hypothetical protein GCM10023168_02430 [Fodinibacter luteus]|uniref:Metal-dependent HD superfamily phosphohydrolase n=1 Tax=Fodinibacter luteus TaxID=552064 RepID=A0ABP8JXZ9_9MICO
MHVLGRRWVADCAAAAPTADPAVVEEVGRDLLGRWQEPHRRYHGTAHLGEVLAAVDTLCTAERVPADDRTVARLAAWFHDAVYAVGPVPPGGGAWTAGAAVDAAAGASGDARAQGSADAAAAGSADAAAAGSADAAAAGSADAAGAGAVRAAGAGSEDASADASTNEIASARLAARQLERLGVGPAATSRVVAVVLDTLAHELSDAAAEDPARVVVHDADLWVLAAPVARFDEYCTQVRQEYAHVPAADYARARSGVLRPFLARGHVYRTAFARAAWEPAARENLARELTRLAG